MILCRQSASFDSDHEQASSDWKCYGTEARINFHRFGAGSERFSQFEICLGWEDVKKIIEAMADEGHLDAIHVRNALKLADAVKNIAAISN